MDKDTKYWILTSLVKTTHKEGINVNNLFFNEKPYFFEFDFNTFWYYLKDLEKENLIEFVKESINPKIRITDKGEREIRKFKNQDELEYNKIRKNFPVLDLQERIKYIERFIWSAVLLVIAYLFLLNKGTTEPIIILFLFAVFLITFVITGTSLSYISMSVYEKFRIDFLNWIFDFIEDHKTWIGPIGIILLNGLGVVLLINLKATVRDIIISLILEGMLALILNWKKITNHIQSIKLGKPQI